MGISLRAMTAPACYRCGRPVLKSLLLMGAVFVVWDQPIAIYWRRSLAVIPCSVATSAADVIARSRVRWPGF